MFYCLYITADFQLAFLFGLFLSCMTERHAFNPVTVTFKVARCPQCKALCPEDFLDSSPTTALTVVDTLVTGNFTILRITHGLKK